MWIDQIVELVPDARLTAVKNVSLAEEYLHDHFSGCDGLAPMPVMPASLIIEGMAQTAGILVGSARRFRHNVILAKITTVRLDFDVFPGETIRYEAQLQRIDDAGAATSGTVSRVAPATGRYEPLGQIDLMFSHVTGGLDVPADNFVFGENLKILLQAEQLRTLQEPPP